jgi:hypothetical protein
LRRPLLVLLVGAMLLTLSNVVAAVPVLGAATPAAAVAALLSLDASPWGLNDHLLFAAPGAPTDLVDFDRSTPAPALAAVVGAAALVAAGLVAVARAARRDLVG